MGGVSWDLSPGSPFALCTPVAPLVTLRKIRKVVRPGLDSACHLLQESSEEEESDEEEEEKPAPAAKKAKTENGAVKTKPAAAAADAGAAQGSRTIFIKNLPWSADEAMLSDFFSECGPIAETRIGEACLTCGWTSGPQESLRLQHFLVCSSHLCFMKAWSGSAERV